MEVTHTEQWSIFLRCPTKLALQLAASSLHRAPPLHSAVQVTSALVFAATAV